MYQRIEALLFKNGKDDYEIWSGFSLSQEDKSKIMDILSKYETEGCSVRGTLDQCINETFRNAMNGITLRDLLDLDIPGYKRIRCWEDDSYPITYYDGDDEDVYDLSDDIQNRKVLSISLSNFAGEQCLLIELDTK